MLNYYEKYYFEYNICGGAERLTFLRQLSEFILKQGFFRTLNQVYIISLINNNKIEDKNSTKEPSPCVLLDKNNLTFM